MRREQLREGALGAIQNAGCSRSRLTVSPLLPLQVRAMATICSSPRTAADLSLVLEPTLVELTSFLRKANRMLRQAALAALEVGGGGDFKGRCHP